jgi:hypothetical protein
MTEPTDIDAERAWQQLACPRPARFWNVALELDEWTADERQHVESCAHCRAAAEQVLAAARNPAVTVQVAAAVLVAGMVLVARRLLRRLPAKQYTDTTGPSPELRLSFDGDPHLEAVLFREQGEHWLRLEHRQLPAGTMVQVSVSEPGAPGWSRYLVLRADAKHVVARIRIESALPDDGRDRQLAVRILSAAALSASDGMLLQQSFAAVSHDDPAARPAWESWARRARQEVADNPELVMVLDEIASPLFRP